MFAFAEASEKRYFTITGDVVGERYEICERQRQLSEVYEIAFGETRKEEPMVEKF